LGYGLRWAKEAMYEMLVQIPHVKGQFLGEKNMPGHAQRHSALSGAKVAVHIEMSFGLWTRGPKEACVTWGAYWRNLANTIELFVFGWAKHSGGDVAVCQITLTTRCCCSQPAYITYDNFQMLCSFGGLCSTAELHMSIFAV